MTRPSFPLWSPISPISVTRPSFPFSVVARRGRTATYNKSLQSYRCCSTFVLNGRTRRAKRTPPIDRPCVARKGYVMANCALRRKRCDRKRSAKSVGRSVRRQAERCGAPSSRGAKRRGDPDRRLRQPADACVGTARSPARQPLDRFAHARDDGRESLSLGSYNRPIYGDTPVFPLFRGRATRPHSYLQQKLAVLSMLFYVCSQWANETRKAHPTHRPPVCCSKRLRHGQLRAQEETMRPEAKREVSRALGAASGGKVGGSVFARSEATWRSRPPPPTTGGCLRGNGSKPGASATGSLRSRSR